MTIHDIDNYRTGTEKPLLTSLTCHLLPVASDEYREDIFLDPQDALAWKISDGDYAVLSVRDIIPEEPPKQLAVRVNIDKGSSKPLSLKINSRFFEDLRFSPGQDWELSRMDESRQIEQVVLEPCPSYAFGKGELAHLDKSRFYGRSLLIGVGQSGTDFVIKTDKHRGFRVRELSPEPFDVVRPTVFSIEPSTNINISTPRRESGMDLVVILDVSKSMNLKDFESGVGQVMTRAEAALGAVRMILEWYSHRSTRGSRFGFVVFGKNARIVFPDGLEKLSEIEPQQAEALCGEIPSLFRRVDIAGSNVFGALSIAATLLDSTPSAGNDAMFILISDGAYWTGQIGGGEDNNIETFVGRFYDERKIRIHTMVVGNKDSFRKLEQRYYRDDMTRPEGKRVHTPNSTELMQIAQLTNGRHCSVETAKSLQELFEE